jgi:hypothetical protein
VSPGSNTSARGGGDLIGSSVVMGGGEWGGGRRNFYHKHRHPQYAYGNIKHNHWAHRLKGHASVG